MLSPGRTPLRKQPRFADAHDGVGRAVEILLAVDDFAAEYLFEKGDHRSPNPCR